MLWPSILLDPWERVVDELRKSEFSQNTEFSVKEVRKCSEGSDLWMTVTIFPKMGKMFIEFSPIWENSLAGSRHGEVSLLSFFSLSRLWAGLDVPAIAANRKPTLLSLAVTDYTCALLPCHSSTQFIPCFPYCHNDLNYHSTQYNRNLSYVSLDV